MATRELLTPAQRLQFTTFPALSARDLVRYYTFSPDDLAIISRHRRPHNRLGFAVQLALLRFPGRAFQVDDPVPAAVVATVAAQLDLDAAALHDYARERDTTRREHLGELQQTFGFRTFDARAYRELANWLLPTALSTDSGPALVATLLDELRARKIIAPALSTTERLAWETRRRAQRQVFARLTEGLTDTQRHALDALLTAPPASTPPATSALPVSSSQAPSSSAHPTASPLGGRTIPLTELRQPLGRPAPATFLKVVARLERVRALGLDPEVARQVHQNRLRRLAREGARYTPFFLQRFAPERRYATLVAFLLDTGATLTDHALDLHDRLIGQFHAASQHAHAEQFQQSGRAINEKVRLYAAVGKALIAAKEQAADPFQAIQAVVPWDTFVSSVAEAERLARPADFDPLELLDGSYSQLRRYAPALLHTFAFSGAPSSQPLLDALEVLKRLHAAERQGGRARKVPPGAPTGFVRPRWEPHVFTDKGIDRTYYEFCVLSELRDRLRAGDVWVAGSKQYKSFEDYLLPDVAWQEVRRTGPVPVAVETDCHAYLTRRRQEVDETMTKVANLMDTDALPDVRLRNGRLVITPLVTAVPPDAEALVQETSARLPLVKITELLVEVDELTGFSRHFTHLENGRPPKDLTALYAVLLADATNLGLEKMAQACPGYSFHRLAWVANWHVRDETYTRALAEVVNAHHRQPFATIWGEGTTSSSDAQRFPAGGRRESIGQVNARYGREPSVKFYTHISDQYDPYYPNVISATASEAPYLLDGLLYHETDLHIEEHYADTGAFTDQLFGICHLLGFRFAPRIRDLADKRLYPFEKPAAYPVLLPLIGGRVQTKQIEDHWDGLLRLGSSIRLGTVTASLILRKLASYPRQNGLAWALRELGRVERTLFTLEWLQSPELRRRVTVGLNKGEAKNALARAVCFHRHGAIHDRAYEDQRHRASGLNLVVAAIVLWNTIYLDLAVDDLRAAGMAIPDEHLQHLSPLGWEHIALTGEYRWEPETARRPGERRPLRRVS
ncbi:MAG: Tn3 family transposase [Chloroflexota bacterium]